SCFTTLTSRSVSSRPGSFLSRAPPAAATIRSVFISRVDGATTARSCAWITRTSCLACESAVSWRSRPAFEGLRPGFPRRGERIRQRRRDLPRSGEWTRSWLRPWPGIGPVTLRGRPDRGLPYLCVLRLQQLGHALAGLPAVDEPA